MYQLYYAPGTCSLAVHVILNELDQAVELKQVSLKEARTPEFLKVNPRGSVPVLVDNGTVIREGGAIITYLLDKHHSDLLARDGAKRASSLEWLMFANATMHPAYSRLFFFKAQLGADAENNPLYKATLQTVQKLWDSVEDQLSRNTYIAGDTLTGGDILLTVISSWASVGQFNFGPKTKDLFKRVSSRPAFQKALDAEKVEFKVAA